MNIAQLVAIIGSAIAGAFLTHNVRVAVYPYLYAVQPPTRLGRLRRRLFPPMGGWHNRLVLAVFVFTAPIIQLEYWTGWVTLGLYWFILNMGLNDAAFSGWRTGTLEQNMPGIVNVVGEAVSEAVGDKRNVAFVEVPRLIELGDQYGVPPEELMRLIHNE